MFPPLDRNTNSSLIGHIFKPRVKRGRWEGKCHLTVNLNEMEWAKSHLTTEVESPCRRDLWKVKLCGFPSSPLFFHSLLPILSEPSITSLLSISRLRQRYFDPSFVVIAMPKPSGSVRPHLLTNGKAETNSIWFPRDHAPGSPPTPVKPGPFQLASLPLQLPTTQALWRMLCSQEVSSRIGPAQLIIPPGTDCLIIILVSHFLSNVYSLGKDASGRENVYPVMTFLTRVSWVYF